MERGNRRWHQWLQIAQAVGWSAENHQRDPPSGKILLIGNVLIDGDQDIETSSFGSLQEEPILQSRQISEASRLAVVAEEQKPQALVDALID